MAYRRNRIVRSLPDSGHCRRRSVRVVAWREDEVTKPNHSKCSRTLALLTTALLAPGILTAHHSFAPYERDLQIQLDGTVARFQWTNPHVYIELAAQDENGETSRWTIECANPGILNRVGWKWNMIKEGDAISVIVSPLRNGEAGALLKSVRLADGTIHSNGGPAGPATISFDD